MPSAAPIFRAPGTRPDADRSRQRVYDRQRRETQPARRWYGLAAWQRRRAAQLAGEPLCRVCDALGAVTLATVADHVIPHRGDWDLFIGGELQSLCKPCHDGAKAREEAALFGAARPEWLRPSAIPLTIVTGPTAAGKNHYVEQHADPSDLIIDLDAIAGELSGQPGHDWDRQRWLGPALNERNRMLGSLAKRRAGRAWFIVAAPTPDARAWWEDKLRPIDTVVLETCIRTCMTRIREASDRNRDRSDDAASAWWAGYQRRQGETVIVTRERAGQ